MYYLCMFSITKAQPAICTYLKFVEGSKTPSKYQQEQQNART